MPHINATKITKDGIFNPICGSNNPTMMQKIFTMFHNVQKLIQIFKDIFACSSHYMWYKSPWQVFTKVTKITYNHAQEWR
jgi:hypothetical protein